MSDAANRRSALADFFARLVKEQPLGIGGGIIVLIFIFVAIFADVLAPYGFLEVHLRDRLQGSSAQYPLGTDHLGRDLLSRVVYGARLSIAVGLAATSLNVVVALLIGGTAGFLGGKFDLAVQRLVDAWMAFPGLLLLLTIMSLVGRGRNTDNSRPGCSWRHRRLESNARRGRRYKGECLFSGRRGDWLLEMASVCPTCAAQYHARRSHHIQHQHRRGDDS